jgi:hypothetical protein
MPINKEDKIILIAVSGIAVVYFGLLNPLLKYLGIKDSEETKLLDNEASATGSPWNPNFYKSVPNAIILKRAYAENLAQTIYNSFGYFNDNEEQATGAIKSLMFKTQVSFLSQVFYELYKQDLLKFLRGGNYPQDRLSDKDVNELNLFVNKLPLR